MSKFWAVIGMVMMFLLGYSVSNFVVASPLPVQGPSPADRISESQIHVMQDNIIIDLPNATWAQFADTNSMVPTLDVGHNSIEIKPNSQEDIVVGDIISYHYDGVGDVIHRVTFIGNDTEGWYALVKGDNNQIEDPDKVRFNQILGIIVAVIY